MGKTSPFIKCDSHICKAERYPNQPIKVEACGREYRICQDCEAKLLAPLRDRDFLAFIIRTSLSLGEIVRIDKEKAADYAAVRYQEEVLA